MVENTIGIYFNHLLPFTLEPTYFITTKTLRISNNVSVFNSVKALTKLQTALTKPCSFLSVSML